MSRRYLVLGGAGFLGSHVARWLCTRGHRVRIFDRVVPAFAARAVPPELELAEGDFFNVVDVESALEGIDTVLHFVSLTVPASSASNVPVEIEGNLVATVRLLDAMVRRGIRRIGFPSSGGTVYGPRAEPHREDEPPRPTCPYGLGKVLIEETLRFYRAHHGVDYQVWRIANPYGDAAKRHLAQGVIDASLHRVRCNEPIVVWGEGTAVRDFVFVDDVAEAVGRLLETEAWGETFNVGSGRGTSIRDVLSQIEKVVGHPTAVRYVDGYTGPAVSVLDASKLRQTTAWVPAFDLEKGIREAWRRLTA